MTHSMSCSGLATQVKLVQADNFAWFGFPDDTEPSSREFVPGLKTVCSLARHMPAWLPCALSCRVPGVIGAEALQKISVAGLDCLARKAYCMVTAGGGSAARRACRGRRAARRACSIASAWACCCGRRTTHHGKAAVQAVQGGGAEGHAASPRLCLEFPAIGAPPWLHRHGMLGCETSVGLLLCSSTRRA